MAKNPAKGNLDQGLVGRQGSERALVAAESMCTKPVARMTPAAKALAATKRLLSVRRKRHCFPTKGMAIPTTPAIRIDPIAMTLRTSAADSSRSLSESVPPQVVLDMDADSVWKIESFSVQKQTTPRF